MKKVTSCLLAIAFAFLAIATALHFSRARAQAQTVPASKSPVVVELFTSEGCSDCPPADALLLRMEQQPLSGVEIIPLEEHVDYWDHLGWADPYSSAEWTQRQVEYINKAKEDSPYTPEMVVNGESQFVGSDGRQAQHAIERAAGAPQTLVTISPERPDSKDSASFAVTVGKLSSHDTNDAAEVWLAITEDGLRSSVKGGENAGRALSHGAVLRSLRKIGVATPSKEPDSFTTDSKVKFEPNWKRENLRVVVFVQERKSFKILGAASARITD